MTLGRAAVVAGALAPWVAGGRCRFAHRRKCTESTSPRRCADRGVCNASRPCSTRLSRLSSAFHGMLGELGEATQRARPAQQRAEWRCSARQGLGGEIARRRAARRRWRRRGRASAARRPPAARASRAAPRRRPRPPCPERRATPPRRRRAAPAPARPAAGRRSRRAAPRARRRLATAARPPRPRSAAARGAIAWQRLRIVGSKPSGAAVQSTKRASPARLFERLQEGIGGDRVHALGRMDDDRLAAAARRGRQCQGDRGAHLLDPDVLARLLLAGLVFAALVRRPQPPSPGLRAAPRAAAPAGRDANAPPPAGSSRSCRRAARPAARSSIRTASPAPASRPSSNWPTPARRVQQQGMRGLRLERAAAAARRARAAPVRLRRGSAIETLAQRLSDAQCHRGAAERGVDAHEPIAALPSCAPGSPDAPARRTPGPRPRTGRRPAPRRGAAPRPAARGRTRASGRAAAPPAPLLRGSAAAPGSGRGRSPGRRRSRR